jgi:hypothetical protein
MKTLRIVALAFAALSANCGGTPPDYPSLCVILADGASTGAAASTTDQCGVTTSGSTLQCADDFTVADGQGFVVLHQLPDDIVTDASLHLTIETPCAKVESDHKHVMSSDESCLQPELRIPVTAPPGASCSLVITASIANHTAQRISRSTNCTDVTSVCKAAEANAGSGSGGGGN